MKQLRKSISLLLTLALCMALMACGKTSAVTIEDFVSSWRYGDVYVAVTIYDDGAWYYDWMNDEIENHSGTARLKDGKLELLEDGEIYTVLTMQNANTLIDEDDDVLYRTPISDVLEDYNAVEADFLVHGNMIAMTPLL